MLSLFRRYQRYIYIIITTVIVISFSFFGTYSVLDQQPMRTETAFIAIDGSKISEQEVYDLYQFLRTDRDDKLISGGAWGPNFLNDGVFIEDFLKTGFAALLLDQLKPRFQEELQARLNKEKQYIPYAHPKAPFVGSSTVWQYLAPDMGASLELLQSVQDATSPEAIQARVNLFLIQRKFPPPLLRQMVRYQEKQYSWLPHDPNLDRIDLSLFGYRSLEDWFGPQFMQAATRLIINCAILAEQQGYEVAADEVWASLTSNAEQSFEQNMRNPNLGVANSRQYLEEQLRLLGMDKNQAIKTWKKVLLFRRLFDSVGNGILINPLLIDDYAHFAFETLIGKRYQLPQPLRFSDYRDLQKFQVYLEGVSKQSPTDLALPDKLFNLEQVSKNTPELVQRELFLEIAQIKRSDLEARIPVREAWNWEEQESNWEKLKKQFSELGVKPGKTAEERRASIDQLDRKTRFQVDGFARAAIINGHPEHLEEALQQAPVEKKRIALPLRGKSLHFAGLTNAAELLSKLDKAYEEGEEIPFYTADMAHYYRIKVVEAPKGAVIMTFTEANESAILDQLLDAKLEQYYLAIRKDHPKDFQKSDGGWQPYSVVQRQVADRYFSKLLEKIRKEEGLDQLNGERAASLRFAYQMRQVRHWLQKEPKTAASWIQGGNEGENDPLFQQWQLVEGDFRANRTEQSPEQKGELFELAADQYSSLFTPPNGDLAFVFVAKKELIIDEAKRERLIEQVQGMLSNEAKKIYLVKLLTNWNNAVLVSELAKQ